MALSAWLLSSRLALLTRLQADCAPSRAPSGETLERWVFDLHADKSIGPTDKVDKSDKEIQAEIAAIQRQISASVTFLPLFDEPCAFDLLVYTDDDVQVPTLWENSDPKMIVNADEVKLRSFTTKIHKVDASVSYKTDA